MDNELSSIYYCVLDGQWYNVYRYVDDLTGEVGWMVETQYSAEVPDWVKQFPPAWKEASAVPLCPTCGAELRENEFTKVEIPAELRENEFTKVEIPDVFLNGE